MTENQDLQEVVAAAQAWMDLRDEIRKAGIPPHTDYWHQSIHEAEERLREALARVGRGT